MASPGGLSESVLERADFPEGPVLVALSGGADSAVLLWAARSSAGPVRAVFVDHGLAHSARLREAADRIAARLEVALDVVAAPVDRDTVSFEDTARTARYAALEEAATAAESILTGHTSDDQAETVLGNLLRGAGTRGLAGIPRVRGRIFRPLLSVSRAETRRLAADLELPFFDDPDNADPRLRRSWIRHELIPSLEADFNPGLREALGRTAAIVAADDAALEAQSNRIPVLRDDEAVFIPAALLELSEPALAARAVRRAIRMIRGPHRGLHDEAAAVLDVAVRARQGAEIGAGIRADREGPFVVLHGAALSPRATVPVSVPGRVVFDRWEIELSGERAIPSPRFIGGRVVVLAETLAAMDLRLEPAVVGGSLDLGEGTKRVRAVLADAGVPLRLRDRWPVLWAADRVVWVPGSRGADWARPEGGQRCVVGEVRKATA